MAVHRVDKVCVGGDEVQTATKIWRWRRRAVLLLLVRLRKQRLALRQRGLETRHGGTDWHWVETQSWSPLVRVSILIPVALVVGTEIMPSLPRRRSWFGTRASEAPWTRDPTKAVITRLNVWVAMRVEAASALKLWTHLLLLRRSQAPAVPIEGTLHQWIRITRARFLPEPLSTRA